MSTICLAGGCFWGVERLCRSLPGVVSATVGYANGSDARLASYRQVCTGATGFREAAAVEYDPALLPLERLLFAFFAVIDTEDYHRQGPDIGSQYQTGVYWSDPETEKTVRRVAAVESAGVEDFSVELLPLTCFYPAEEAHQRYLEKNPRGYCHVALWRLAALRDYPFDPAGYTRPAAQLLREYRDRLEGEQP